MKETKTAIRRTIVISAGESISTVLDKSHYSYMAISLPSDWTTAAITFLACDTIDGTFQQVVHSTDASEVNIPSVAASKFIVLDTEFLEAIIAIPYLRIRSGTLNAPVNQVAEANIKIILRR